MNYTMIQCPGWLEQGDTAVCGHMSQQPATGTEGQEGQTWVQVAEGEAQGPAGVSPGEAEREEPQEYDVSYELVAKPGHRQWGRKEGSGPAGCSWSCAGGKRQLPSESIGEREPPRAGTDSPAVLAAASPQGPPWAAQRWVDQQSLHIRAHTYPCSTVL